MSQRLNITAKIVITSAIMVIFVVGAIKLIPGYERAKRIALNEVGPSTFDELVLSVEKKQKIDHKRLKAFLRYFQEVARLSPERADAVGMQGFCFYQLGEYERAMNSYEKAIRLLPQFSGFHYNLTVIYFKLGQYAKATDQLEKFFASDPKESLVYILSSSKVYAFMMLTKLNVLGKTMEDQVKDGYQKAYQLMLMCKYRLQSGNPAPGEEELLLEDF